MLFSGAFQTAEEAIEFYGKKRFKHGIGITQPCQIRYVKYFEQILKEHVVAPTIKTLKGIEMVTVPNIKNKTCRPYVEIVQVKDMTILFSGRKIANLKKYHMTVTKKIPESDNHLFVKEGSVDRSEKSSNSNYQDSENSANQQHNHRCTLVKSD